MQSQMSEEVQRMERNLAALQQKIREKVQRDRFETNKKGKSSKVCEFKAPENDNKIELYTKNNLHRSLRGRLCGL